MAKIIFYLFNCVCNRIILILCRIIYAFMSRIFMLLAVVAVVFISCRSGKETASLQPQNWSGEIVAGAKKITLFFTINTFSDGKQICTMDVPEQGAKDIPVELLKNDADSLNLSVPALGAAYKGRKISSENIEGCFTQNGMKHSLNIKPGGVELIRPQTPMPPFEYETEEVIFKNEAEGVELSGTLTYPMGYEKCKSGSVPVVLMVTGSGSQDRNEEIFGHKPFLVIADFLAKNGIASLRYDDRGVGKSKGSLKGVTTMNYLADAEAGVSYLRNLNRFGMIGVLGHSEGGTIAFMMGADKKVDFIISLAGVAAAGIDVIVGQNEAAMQLQGVPQQVVSHYAAALRMVYEDRVVGKDVADKLQYVDELCRKNELLLPDNLKFNLEKCITFGGEWFTWFLRYNPKEAVGRIACPAMVLNGKKDLQVLSKDNIPVIKKNLPYNDRNLVKEYDSLNHLFQHCTFATALDYGAIKETFSEEVLDDIVNWIDTIR